MKSCFMLKLVKIETFVVIVVRKIYMHFLKYFPSLYYLVIFPYCLLYRQINTCLNRNKTRDYVLNQYENAWSRLSTLHVRHFYMFPYRLLYRQINSCLNRNKTRDYVLNQYKNAWSRLSILHVRHFYMFLQLLLRNSNVLCIFNILIHQHNCVVVKHVLFSTLSLSWSQ